MLLQNWAKKFVIARLLHANFIRSFHMQLSAYLSVCLLILSLLAKSAVQFNLQTEVEMRIRHSYYRSARIIIIIIIVVIIIIIITVISIEYFCSASKATIICTHRAHLFDRLLIDRLLLLSVCVCMSIGSFLTNARMAG